MNDYLHPESAKADAPGEKPFRGHTLVVGQTGSGKTTLLSGVLNELLKLNQSSGRTHRSRRERVIGKRGAGWRP